MRKWVALISLAVALGSVTYEAAVSQDYVLRRLTPKDMKYQVGNFDRPSQTGGTTVTRPGFTPINVTAFGLDSTGATSCQDSMQALVDSVATWGGGVLYFPAGTYKFDSINLDGIVRDYDGIHFVGDGESTVFYQNDGANDDMFFIRRSTNITFRNIMFNGNASNQTDGSNSYYGGNYSCVIIARDVNSVGSSAGVQEGQLRVEDCYFYNWFWDAMNISSDSWGLVVENCFFDGNGFTGGDTYHFGINNQCKQFSINNNQFRNIDGGAIYFEGDDTALNETTYTSVDGFGYCGGNQIENCLWGIRSQNLGIAHSIVGNQIRDCESGIAMDGSGLSQSGESDWEHQNIVANNAIRNITKSTLGGEGIVMINQRNAVVSGNSVENAVIGMKITTSQSMSITGNTVRKCQATGVRISDSANLSITGNVIMDNMQSAAGTYETSGSEAGITVFSTGSSDDIVISGNVIGDDQSSATQPYGVRLYHTITDIRVVDNIFRGNVTANVSDRNGNSLFLGRVFDVLDYGAVGDGTTDDGAAIQAAIDAAEAVGGGEVYFPFTSSGYKIATPPISVTDTDVVLTGPSIPSRINGGGPRILWGQSTPVDAVWAPLGSLYMYADADSTLMVKTDADSTDGWALAP